MLFLFYRLDFSQQLAHSSVFFGNQGAVKHPDNLPATCQLLAPHILHFYANQHYYYCLRMTTNFAPCWLVAKIWSGNPNWVQLIKIRSRTLLVKLFVAKAKPSVYADTLQNRLIFYSTSPILLASLVCFNRNKVLHLDGMERMSRAVVLITGQLARKDCFACWPPKMTLKSKQIWGKEGEYKIR